VSFSHHLSELRDIDGLPRANTNDFHSSTAQLGSWDSNIVIGLSMGYYTEYLSSSS